MSSANFYNAPLLEDSVFVLQDISSSNFLNFVELLYKVISQTTSGNELSYLLVHVKVPLCDRSSNTT